MTDDNVQLDTEVNEPTALTEEQLVNLSDDELSTLNLETLTQGNQETTTESVEGNAEEQPLETEPTQTEEQHESEQEIDYKAFYDAIHQPFKANGQQMQIKSAEEVISLMQKGVNYHKKTSELKPKTRMLKMLEKAGLQDENQLAFLIDLNNRNPEAIAKLVADAGIDAFDLEDKVNPNYQPSVPQISDVELQLEETIEDLRMSSPSFARTIDVAGNQWDARSQQVIAQNPQLLRGLDAHIQQGIYDVIDAEIKRQRTFGQLHDVSDLEAYKIVGDQLNAQGAFTHLTPQQQQMQQTQAEQQRTDKRMSAGMPTQVAQPKQLDIDPRNLTDEQVLALVSKLGL